MTVLLLGAHARTVVLCPNVGFLTRCRVLQVRAVLSLPCFIVLHPDMKFRKVSPNSAFIHIPSELYM